MDSVEALAGRDRQLASLDLLASSQTHFTHNVFLHKKFDPLEGENISSEKGLYSVHQD